MLSSVLAQAGSGGIYRKPVTFLIIGLVLGGLVVGLALFFLFQLGSSAQQPSQTQKSVTISPALQKFKASGYSPSSEMTFLVFDAGSEQHIWAKNGLDPEFVFLPDGRPMVAADIKQQVDSGVKIGISAPSELLKARSMGTSVKIVAAYVGETLNNIYVSEDSPILSLRDLDGKKIGVIQIGGAQSRQVTYLNVKAGINAETVAVGNITNMLVALKLGKIDAFIGGEIAPLRLVDSGELRILVRLADIFPKPYVSRVLFATEDLIDQNPELVRSFVKGWFETVKYLKDNPSYAADLYIKKANAPRDLADKAITQIDWSLGGQGPGDDLVAAVTNTWKVSKDSGAIPANININIEETVDTRFLP